MCFVDTENAFDRVPRKVMEWAMRQKGPSEVMVQAVMSLYDGAKTNVRVGSAYSEKFEVKVGVHQGYVLSPLLLAIVVDVITENARRVWLMNYCVQMTLFSRAKPWKTIKEKILELEGCTGK